MSSSFSPTQRTQEEFVTSLKISHLSYPEASLEKWRKKKYQILRSSKASSFLKRILETKAAKRGATQRFFGEAYVAANTRHKHGYYSSFKWLTNPRFSDSRKFTGKGMVKEFQVAFRDALLRYFGKSELVMLQKKAIGFEKQTGITPVPPDLWLVDRYGNHRFIEVKLPGDSIKARQIAGMAVIATYLLPKSKLSVEIINLDPTYGRAFDNFCRVLKNVG